MSHKHYDEYDLRPVVRNAAGEPVFSVGRDLQHPDYIRIRLLNSELLIGPKHGLLVAEAVTEEAVSVLANGPVIESKTKH